METIKIIHTLGAERVWLGGVYVPEQNLGGSKTLPGAQIHVARKLKLLSGVRVNL